MTVCAKKKTKASRLIIGELKRKQDDRKVSRTLMTKSGLKVAVVDAVPFIELNKLTVTKVNSQAKNSGVHVGETLVSIAVRDLILRFLTYHREDLSKCHALSS